MTSPTASSPKQSAVARTVEVLDNDVARYYTHLHPILILTLYYSRFPTIVANPVGALSTLLIGLSVLQAAYAVLCLPPTGGGEGPTTLKPGHRKKPGAAKTDTVLSQKLVPAILSITLALNAGTPVLSVLLVLFGAPMTSHWAQTLLCASHISLLATSPLIYVHGVDARRWRDIVALMVPVDEVFGAAVGTLLGAWFGAVPIPLDWDREWQKWPVTIVTGAYIGYVVGKLLGGFVLKGKRIELN